MGVHDLTEKELKALDNAVSTVKKFKKYIEQVNLSNRWLEENLSSAIKAGDVTNAQKVDLRAAESARKCYRDFLSEVQNECRSRKCPINLDHNRVCPDSCELKQRCVVLEWMFGISRGNQTDWELIFQYALNGRKLWANRYLNQHFKVTP